MALLAVGYENFLGGVVSSIPVNELNDNQLAKCDNAVVTERAKPGILKKRLGYSLNFNQSLTNKIKHTHEFLKNDGTSILLFAEGNNVRKRDSATTSTILDTQDGAGDITIITSHTDFAMWAVASGSVKRYDGTTVSTASAPAGTTTAVIETHKGRIWTPDGTTKNKLYFSAIANEADWTSVDNAGNIILRMPKIVGIRSIGESGMVCCDEFATILLVGDGAQSFSQVELSNRYGCKSFKSMVNFGNFMLMLGDVGVVGVSSAGMELLSLPVDDVITAMSDTTKKNSRAFRFEDWYVLCYDDNGDGQNDAALMFDTKFGVWARLTNQPFSSGTARADGTTVVGSDAANGKLYQWWNGTTDDGAAITMTVETKGWDFGRWFSRKQIRQGYFQTNATGAFNLTTRPIVDGSVAGSDQTINVNSRETSQMFPDSAWGRVIQLRLTNAGSTDNIELRSMVALSELAPAGEL